jgi:glycerol dehydrogenase-like iron-containing ADH family enzyme
MDSGNEYHPEQIPTEYNEEQTLRTVRRQSQIPGERKEKTINDFPKAAAVGQILKDLDFPADKRTIITFVEKLNTPQRIEILPMIEKLDEKRYESVSEVANAIGLVE